MFNVILVLFYFCFFWWVKNYIFGYRIKKSLSFCVIWFFWYIVCRNYFVCFFFGFFFVKKMYINIFNLIRLIFIFYWIFYCIENEKEIFFMLKEKFFICNNCYVEWKWWWLKWLWWIGCCLIYRSGFGCWEEFL